MHEDWRAWEGGKGAAGSADWLPESSHHAWGAPPPTPAAESHLRTQTQRVSNPAPQRGCELLPNGVRRKMPSEHSFLYTSFIMF